MLIAALAIAAGSRVATAEPTITIQPLPPECLEFTSTPRDAVDSTPEWMQLLSLAACLQDTTIVRITSRDQLEPMVVAMQRQLAVPTRIYLAALQQAPGPIQLRAAFHLAMAHVALVVRARRALPEPAASSELEPLLVHSLELARISFEVIDRAVIEAPQLANDEVTRNMVRVAREMLTLLPAMTPDEGTLAGSAHSTQPAAIHAPVRATPR